MFIYLPQKNVAINASRICYIEWDTERKVATVYLGMRMLIVSGEMDIAILKTLMKNCKGDV